MFGQLLQVSAGGIVEDQAVRELVMQKVIRAAEKLGLQLLGSLDSPIRGRVGGNQEALVGFRLAASSLAPETEIVQSTLQPR